MSGAPLTTLTPLSLRPPPAAGRMFRRPAAARDPGTGGPADTAPDDTAPDDTAPDDAALDDAALDDAAHRTARRLLEEAGLL